MQLPVGALVFWANKFDEDHYAISCIWYYKEMFAPTKIEAKLQAVNDLKSKRCTVLIIHGSFSQICDILAMGDHFMKEGVPEVSLFVKLVKELEVLPVNKPYMFDDVYNVKGTSLAVETMFEIEETRDYIRDCINKSKVVDVNISKNWSMVNDLLKSAN